MDGPELERHDLDATFQWALKVGEHNLKGLALLDKAHRKCFGAPVPTEVPTTPIPGKVNTVVLLRILNDLIHLSSVLYCIGTVFRLGALCKVTPSCFQSST